MARNGGNAEILVHRYKICFSGARSSIEKHGSQGSPKSQNAPNQTRPTHTQNRQILYN